MHYRVRVKPNSTKWRLVTVGGRKERKVSTLAYPELGFSAAMSVEDAKEQAKRLNHLQATRRKEQSAQIRAAERYEDLAKVQNSIIPEELNSLFLAQMSEDFFGSKSSLRKQVIVWKKCQEVVTTLKLQPQDYYVNKKAIYKLFVDQKLSLSYVEKILKVLNLWGDFYSRRVQSYFRNIPMPTGIIRETIREASTATGLGARPLTVDVLANLNGKLPVGQWEWLRASLWLGLRPIELDLMANTPPETYKVKGVVVLSVYQSKLVGVSKKDRYKQIPLIFEEQRKALSDILTGVIKKPLSKTINKYVSDFGGYSLYSGRKGFVDLMLSLGQTLENISMWMGHTTLDRTWRHYKDRQKVNWD